MGAINKSSVVTVDDPVFDASRIAVRAQPGRSV